MIVLQDFNRKQIKLVYNTKSKLKTHQAMEQYEMSTQIGTRY